MTAPAGNPCLTMPQLGDIFDGEASTEPTAFVGVTGCCGRAPEQLRGLERHVTRAEPASGHGGARERVPSPGRRRTRPEPGAREADLRPRARAAREGPASPRFASAPRRRAARSRARDGE